MSVERNSAPVEFRPNDTRKYVAPQIAASNGSVERTIAVGDGAGFRQQLASSIVGLVNSVAGKAVDNQIAEAYLRGTTQASIGASEESLQNDTMTRDWEVAGFRDTMGKLKEADADARLASDMNWLREKSPEEFKQYLDKQRSELMPSLEGMSLDARQKMLPARALAEQAAVAKHAAEHSKYIRQTIGQSYAGEFTGVFAGLDSARDLGNEGADAYIAYQNHAAGRLFALMTDKRLYPEDRENLMKEAVEYSLRNQHIGLYHMLRDAVMPGDIGDDGQPTGTPSSLLSRLSLKTQDQLGQAYYAAKKATAAIAHTNYTDQLTKDEVMMREGLYTGTYDDLVERLNFGQRNNIINQTQRDGILTSFFKGQLKREGDVGLGTAYFTNNADYIQQSGKTLGDAREAARKAAAHLPREEAITRYAQAGRLGNMDAYKVAGELADFSVAALAGPEGKLDIQHKVAVERVHKLLDDFAANDDKVGEANYYAGMTKENAARLERLRALRAQGIDGQIALDRVLEAEKQDRSMTPQQKAAIADVNAQKDAKYIAELGDNGWFGSILKKLHSVLPTEGGAAASAELTLEGRGGLFATTKVRDTQANLRGYYLSSAKAAVLEELKQVDLVATNLPQEARIRQAQAAVLSRTLDTSSGPVILPRGTTPNSYFGVPSQVPTQVVQQAVEDLFLKPTADGGKFMITATNGKLIRQEYDRNGVPIAGSVVEMDPKQVQSKVRDYENGQMRRVNEEVGEGREYNRDGIKFNFNGVNSAGVAEGNMLAFRNNLLQHEGVRNAPYEDASNKTRTDGKKVMTVGVGISTTNPHYPKVGPNGLVDNAAIKDSFIRASNDAAVLGTKLQQSVGRSGQQSFLLFSELAYQGLGNAKPFMQAMRGNDEGAVLAALKQTRAYELAHTERKQHYEKLALAAFKEK